MTIRHLATIALAALLVTACGQEEKRQKKAFEVNFPFAEYGESYAAKPDFAQLEHAHPLSVDDLYRITPEVLSVLDQEQVDQIYARLSAGPIPQGPYEGDLFFPKSNNRLRLSEIVGGRLKGLLVNVAGKKLDAIGEILWKGKVFYRDERLLRNRIEDLSPLRRVGLVEDGGSANPLQKIEVGGKDQWLLFPARLYCGQSLLDGRRESIIIDYAFTDRLPGYRRMPDVMAGRDGFAIRDEIRMVRPGFYLGRAYIDRAFVVNFVLWNDEVAKAAEAEFRRTGEVAEDCWSGTQARRILTATG
ncbi:MAG: hypothetical protein KDH20_21170 [Rhodocyclaceae bacterium]|nr:hypothetical protein [Rhodocyclaceae bacterium]